jgi:hypothetical protein
VGSGLRKGKRSGILFCAEVELADERRTFLRFVPAEPGWQQPDATKAIERETGMIARDNIEDGYQRAAERKARQHMDSLFDQRQHLYG